MDDLAEDEVLGIMEGCAPRAQVVAIDHEQYIEESRQHPFIQHQLNIGMYEEATFGEEFLSVARSFPNDHLIEVDVWLVLHHMKGVDPAAAFGYVAHVALHEYHHLIHHQGDPVSLPEQMTREFECDAYLRKNHAQVLSLSAQAETQSASIQRVYARLPDVRK